MPRSLSVRAMPVVPQQRTRIRWALIAPLICLSLFSVPAAAQDASAKPTVHNLREIAKALNACMQPLAVAQPYQGMRATVRIGFNNRGKPLGPPGFSYITPNAPDRIKTEYRNAISDGLKRCTPLSFSTKLGATIAGVPVILRFDARGLSQAKLAESSAYVAPAALPSSQVPPERPVPPLPQPPTYQKPPIWLPGLATPVPSLPESPDTSQDRASRCMLQSQLYHVPPADYPQYMGLCTQ
jgi:hypothetical protein